MSVKGTWQREFNGEKYRKNYDRIFKKAADEQVSACCGAPILYSDICSDCGEHCDES